MITGFFLEIVYQFINFLIGLLPLGESIPQTWINGVYTIWSYINSFSFIVPVNTLVSVLAIAVTFHLFIFAWKGLHWIWSLIRGGRVH